MGGAKKDIHAYFQIVVIPGGEGVGGAKKKDKEFELGQQDDFWNNHKGAPFPQVELFHLTAPSLTKQRKYFDLQFLIYMLIKHDLTHKQSLV